MTERYKIWINIERITGEGENEKYEDASPIPWSLGVFDTYEKAQRRVNELIDLPYTGNFSTVDRVWDGEGGISPLDALRRGIKIDCWFVRRDGWTVGTPKEHAVTASELWEDSWSKVYVLEEEGPAIQLTYEEWRALHAK